MKYQFIIRHTLRMNGNLINCSSIAISVLLVENFTISNKIIFLNEVQL